MSNAKNGKIPLGTPSAAGFETASWVASFGLLCFFLRDSLFKGDYSLSHDNFYWVYPIYHFFSSSLAHFSFPLWNPYSHGGEPFYLIPGQIRLLEPLVYPVIFAAKILGMDTVQAFVWNRVLGSLVMCLGVALSLREVAQERVTRVLMPPVLLLSSFTFSSFQQDGLYSQFLWIPYVYWFFGKILLKGENSARSWLPFAAVVGVNSISYFFGGTWLFLLALVCAFALFERESLRALIRQRATRGNILLFLAVNLVMTGPSVMVFLERNNYVFPPRMMKSIMLGHENGGPLNTEGGPEDIVPAIPMTLSMVKSTGTFSSLWDFANSIYLRGNPNLLFAEENWSGKSSEAFFYFGIPVWILGLLGLVFGRHRLKRVWLFLLVFFSLLALGPSGGLLSALYYICPPLWFVRHTHTLFLFIHFFFLFFFVLGADWMLAFDWRGNRIPPVAWLKNSVASLGLGSVVCLILFSLTQRIQLSSGALLAGLAIIILAALALYRWTRSRAFLVPGLVGGQAALILLCVKDRHYFVEDLFCFLFLPLLVSAFLWLRSKRTRGRWFLAPIFLAIPFNLVAAVLWFSVLYSFCPSPRLSHGFDTNFPRTVAPFTRHAAPTMAVDGHYQSVRYPELMQEQAYAFSNLYYWHGIQAEIDRMYPSGGTSLEAFDVARTNRRWSSFLLLRSYFELVNSPINSAVVRSFFAVGSPLFSFREAAVPMPRATWPAFFQRLGGKKSVEFVERFVMEDLASDLRPAELAPVAEAALGKSARDPFFSYSLLAYSANSAVVKVKSARAGLLYWSDGYDPRWHSELDGKKVPIFRVNENFKAVSLPAGEHILAFTFSPVVFEILLGLYYLCFFLCLLGGLAGRCGLRFWHR